MCKSALRLFCLCGFLLTVAIPPIRADVVYLKDGTVLYGKVVTKKEVVDDPISSMSVTITAASGFYAVSDGVRFTIFSTKNLDPGRPPENTHIRAEHIILEREYPRSIHGAPPAGEMRGTTPFNERGERTLNMMTALGPQPIRQRVTNLSPYHMRLDAVEFNWATFFLTQEMDPQVVLRLAKQFDKIAEKDDKPNLEKRLLLIKFLNQCKWYEQAEKEIDRLESDLPKEGKSVAEARENLRQLRAMQLAEEADTSLRAGQLRLAQALLDRVPAGALSGPVNIQVNATRVKIANIVKQMADAQRFLQQLPDEAKGECAEILCEAAAAIRADLYVDGLDRLEPFLSLAEQAERAAEQGRVPAQRPEQLLALAVTGWLLGKESAETKPEVARKLWKARSFALECLATASPRSRNLRSQRYQRDEPVEIEELARVISMLPPPEPEEKIVDEPVKRQTGTALANRRPVEYWVQTPLDYRHGQPCPMLVILHHRGISSEKFMTGYSLFCKRHGYLLVSVDWDDGAGGAYEYTTDEHLRVLDAIRDVKQHYHVDADRIFLHGFGEGANAAFDIGLSHPDQFAGVLPMSSQPKLSATLPLWTNAMNLPFYVVTGDLAGDAPKNILRITQEWITKGFPTLSVFYRGRGVDWFGGELPFMFEWMAHKKRANPFPELGHYPVNRDGAEAYHMMRANDNRYYWISSDSIDERYTYEHKKPKSDVIPARLQGTVSAGNQIRVYTIGLKQVTLSFGPGMIDYDKPVTVKLVGLRGDSAAPWSSKVPLRPDLALMMDDLFERCDTRRPVFVQVRLVP